jgi:hypothetical protein
MTWHGVPCFSTSSRWYWRNVGTAWWNKSGAQNEAYKQDGTVEDCEFMRSKEKKLKRRYGQGWWRRDRKRSEDDRKRFSYLLGEVEIYARCHRVNVLSTGISRGRTEWVALLPMVHIHLVCHQQEPFAVWASTRPLHANPGTLGYTPNEFGGVQQLIARTCSLFGGAFFV